MMFHLYRGKTDRVFFFFCEFGISVSSYVELNAEYDDISITSVSFLDIFQSECDSDTMQEYEFLIFPQVSKIRYTFLSVLILFVKSNNRACNQKLLYSNYSERYKTLLDVNIKFTESKDILSINYS